MTHLRTAEISQQNTRIVYFRIFIKLFKFTFCILHKFGFVCYAVEYFDVSIVLSEEMTD
jgi:hypothetical protein